MDEVEAGDFEPVGDVGETDVLGALRDFIARTAEWEPTGPIPVILHPNHLPAFRAAFPEIPALPSFEPEPPTTT